uniref:CKAP5/XMAP215 n=1 Tax=Halisarca dujardinii TaxID=2583056 RepID=A0A9F1U4L6_HALDU|nr:CKAP5/XMAP215 [Halisarca dujardinii]
MAEEEQEDFSKLSTEDKVTHKSWKARVMGFEELTKLFKRIDDEKSPKFGPYTALLKKFVVDGNVFAQEKALEATLAFVDFAAAAPKVSSDVVAGLVVKAFNGKPKVKQLALDICLLFIEIEKQDVVQEELMVGFKHKQPKIVAACAEALTAALRQFGSKVVGVKPLVKALPPLFDHKDKLVRAAAKGLTVEMYRWLGAALRPTLEGSLKPVQMKELSEDWEKLPTTKAHPERYLRSEMKKMEAQQAASKQTEGAEGEEDSEEDSEEDEEDGGGIDPYELLDPVDILSLLPKDFYDCLVDPKWKVRKEAMEVVAPLAAKPKLAPGNYGELVSAMKKLISKDSNVMVVALAANVVKGLAVGLRKGFQPHATSIMPSMLAKFKEKKQNVVTALREAADAVYLTTSLGAIEEDVKGCLSDKNPSVKTESALFLARCFQQCTPANMPKAMLKAFCPPLVQCLSDTTPTVRDAAAEALGTVLKVVGDRTMGPFLDNLDSLKMAKVTELKDKVELKPPPGAEGKKTGPKKSAKKKGKSSKKKAGESEEEEEEAPEIDPYDLVDPVDILGQIPKDFYDSVVDPKWKVRKEAMEVVAPLAAKPKLAPGDYGELVSAMKKLISKDSNVMVVALAANVVKGLAVGLRKGFQPHATSIMPSMLAKFKEKKQNVVTALREAADAVYLTTSLGAIEEDVKGCLSDKNPSVKTESALFLARCFQQCTPEMMPKAMLKAFCPPLVQCLSDTTPTVRDAAAEALGTVLKVVGDRTMAAFLDGVDDLKVAKITECKDKVVLKVVAKPAKKASKPKKKKAAEDVPDAPSEPAKPKKKVSTKKPTAAASVEEGADEPKASSSSSSPPKKEGASKPVKRGASKAPGKKTTSTTGSSTSAGKKGKDGAPEDSGAPLLMGPPSSQRQKEEQTFKILKWNFSSPRSEFVEELKDKLSACVSPVLLVQLFHSDFKQHLAALTTLKECVSEPFLYKAEAVRSVDLLLKWITLRFCDTNTTVNLKCLEFLAALFSLLITERYRLSEYEASSFLPFLIIKSGDSKDTVRKEVRSLFFQICCVFPPPKVFGFVSDGLKTKNSRQRAECLEVLGVMIQDNGVVVCQPSPQKAVQQISTFIGEKDSTVRNTALNTLVLMFGYMGEALYKHVGKLPAKDLSMLEERIRRAGKRSSPPESATAAPPPSKPSSSSTTTSATSDPPGQSSTEEPPASTGTALIRPRTRTATGKGQQSTSDTFTKDPSDTFTKEASPEEGVVDPPPAPAPVQRRPAHQGPLTVDWSQYVYPQYAVSTEEHKPELTLESLGPDPLVVNPPTSRLLQDPPASLTFSPQKMASTASAVGFIISQITSSDVRKSAAACRQMEGILSKPEHLKFVSVQVDQLIRAILMQFRMNFTTQLQEASSSEDQNEVMQLGKRLTSCLLATFSRQKYASVARRDTLIEAERDVMGMLLSERTLQLAEVAQLNRSLNTVMFQMVDNADVNALFGSLMHVLLESLRLDGSPTKLTELIMRCIWKLTKKLSGSLSSINVDQLLLDAHNFFDGYSKVTSAASVKPADDKPYRTVKTVLWQLVTLIGSKVMDHLVLIENAKTTQVYKYLSKSLIRHKDKEGVVGGSSSTSLEPGSTVQAKPGPQVVPYPVPGAIATRLADALEKVAKKPQRREGFRELFALREEFPEFDLGSRVSANTNIHSHYRDLIERGLQVVQYERDCRAQSTEPQEEKVADMMRTEEQKAALRRVNDARLKVQRMSENDSTNGGGGGGVGRPEPHKTSSAVTCRTAPTTDSDGAPKSRSIPASARPTSSQLQAPSNFDLQGLKKRLAELKKKAS